MKTEKKNRVWLQTLLVCAAMCSGLMSQQTWAQTATKKSHFQLEEERAQRFPNWADVQRIRPLEGPNAFRLRQIEQRKTIGGTQPIETALNAMPVGIGFDHRPDLGLRRGAF